MGKYFNFWKFPIAQAISWYFFFFFKQNKWKFDFYIFSYFVLLSFFHLQPIIDIRKLLGQLRNREWRITSAQVWMSNEWNFFDFHHPTLFPFSNIWEFLFWIKKKSNYKYFIKFILIGSKKKQTNLLILMDSN